MANCAVDLPTDVTDRYQQLQHRSIPHRPIWSNGPEQGEYSRWVLHFHRCCPFLPRNFLVSTRTVFAPSSHSFGFISIGKNVAEDYVQLKPIYPTPIGHGGFLVHNKGCRIPAMDPLDPAIKRFITKEEPLVCEYGNFPPLIESNNTALFVNPLAWDKFYNKSEEISCCWRSFRRTKDQDNAITYVLLADCFVCASTSNSDRK